MACSNCFNNCGEIVSDQCIKYTGVAIPTLGINNGDTLASVELAITNYLMSALNGTGIVPNISSVTVCTLVSSFLPTSGTITIVDIVKALIESVCSLQTQVTAINGTLNTLNSAYTPSCITGIDGTSDTHTVLQAVLNQVCTSVQIINNIVSSLSTDYVLASDLNTLIANYLSVTYYGSSISSKMVPYTAVEYYGPLSNFDITGAGLNLTGSGAGDWTKIYLCNGANGTPDKRGRVPVGATDGQGQLVMDSNVNPSNGNPNYSVYTKGGTNYVTLSTSHLPGHTHIATSTVNDPTHFHYEFNADIVQGVDVTETLYPRQQQGWGNNFDYEIAGTSMVNTLGKSSPSSTGITVSTSNSSTGGNVAHPNIQPVIACYYIIFLP